MGYNTETLRYPSANGFSMVSAKLFLPVDTDIRAIVQISHGMCEYIDRYREFAEFLCARGIMACGNDHIGHRYSVAEPSQLGFFAGQKGDEALVEDVHALTLLMKERYPGVSYFLLGHSMGSMIARCVLAEYGADYDGAIISGTAGPEPGVNAAVALAELMCRLKGPRSPGRMLDRMAFAHYNDRFEGRTDKDWLSRDRAVVDAYRADPYCMFLFTNAAFRDLAVLRQRCNRPDWAAKLPRDLPILLFSGTEDPVGGHGEGVKKVYAMVKQAGVFDATLKLYKGGRHEMLNETNRAEVYRDVYDWLQRKIV